MSNKTKGTLCGVVAAMAYGMNPLFSLNLFNYGLDVESVLFYRFVFAALILAVVMRMRGMRLCVSRREAGALMLGGIIFAMSSQTLYQSFLYMDAGIACSILFIYPILVSVIMTFFFHERVSLLTCACIAVATAGIALLYKGDGSGSLSTVGLLLVAASSLCYSVYIVGVDHSVLSRVPSGKLTVWVLGTGAVVFFVLTGFGERLCAVPFEAGAWGNIVGIALVPTVIPILFINIAIKNIGPTYSAIIGALEPVTALVIGVAVFGEQLTVRIVMGALMILLAVLVIVARPLLVRLTPRIRIHAHGSGTRHPLSRE